MARHARHRPTLSPVQRDELEQLAQASDDRREPAAVILASANGETNTAIGARLGWHPQTVAAVLARFAADGMASLSRRGGGRPAQSSTPAAEQALVLALTRPGPDDAPWTKAAMAAQTGMSARAVAATWSAAGVEPHRRDLSLPGIDPLWHGRARAIAALYLSPTLRLLAAWVRTGRTPSTSRLEDAAAWNAATSEVLGLIHAFPRRLQIPRPQDVAPEGAEGGAAEAALLLNDLIAEWPAGTELHLVADRPSSQFPAHVRRSLAELAVPRRRRRVVLYHTPGPQSWLELTRRALTATQAAYLVRAEAEAPGGPGGLPARWEGELLAAAHNPATTAAHQRLHAPRIHVRRVLDALGCPRPPIRRRAQVEAPGPDEAWQQLVQRHAHHPRHVWPDRPHLALAHLRRHAQEYSLDGRDAVAALVLWREHASHLDLLEFQLHGLTRTRTLSHPLDLATGLGVSVRWLRRRTAALARVTTAGSTAALALHPPRPVVPDRDDETGPAPGSALEMLARWGARSLGEWLVSQWQVSFERLEDPDHHLPDPADYLAVAEHAWSHLYPAPRDELELQVIAALRLVAHLRRSLRADHDFWMTLGRAGRIPYAQLGAVVGRSLNAAFMAHHRMRRLAAAAQKAEVPERSARPSAAAPPPWWQPHAATIHETLRSRLTPTIRQLLRHEVLGIGEGVDTLTELDDELNTAEKAHGPGSLSAAAVNWLLVLLGELSYEHTIRAFPDPDDEPVPPLPELLVRLHQDCAPLRQQLRAASPAGQPGE